MSGFQGVVSRVTEFRKFKKTWGFDLQPRNVWLRYGIALAAFVISITIRLGLDAWLSSDRGFILFLPAVLLVTFFAGLGPAILTAVLSGIALWYIFLPLSSAVLFFRDWPR
jgi:K+-sensing histidine kinase KdpD